MAPTGFFGTPSATIDWCEENYAVTHYVAEFWNTLSSLLILLPGLLGLWQTRQQRLERRFAVAFAFIVVVGLGSVAFHQTLLFHMQTLDELPMIYGAVFSVHLLHDMARTEPGQQHQLGKKFAMLVVFCAFYTWAYFALDNVYIHQVMFTAVMFYNCYLCFKMVWSNYNRDVLEVQAVAAVTMFLGVLAWMTDNQLCAELRSIRAASPAPLRPFLQLHAVWHVLSSWSIYLAIISMTGFRQHFLKRSFEFRWKYCTPLLIVKSPAQVHAHLKEKMP